MPMSYTTLVSGKTTPGSVHNFCNYLKVPVEVVLEEAQAIIYSLLRVREMKTAAVITLTAAASSVALPTGYLEPIAMRDREGWDTIPHNFVEETTLLRRRIYTDDVLETGTPMLVSVFDEAFQFDCKAEEERKYDLVYYKQPTLLSTTNTTNFLTNRYPNILRKGCQAGAASFKQDDVQDYAALLAELTGLIDRANAESDMGRAA